MFKFLKAKKDVIDEDIITKPEHDFFSFIMPLIKSLDEDKLKKLSNEEVSDLLCCFSSIGSLDNVKNIVDSVFNNKVELKEKISSDNQVFMFERACSGNNIDLAKYLVETFEISPYTHDISGAFTWAVMKNNNDILDYLVKDCKYEMREQDEANMNLGWEKRTLTWNPPPSKRLKYS